MRQKEKALKLTAEGRAMFVTAQMTGHASAPLFESWASNYAFKYETSCESAVRYVSFAAPPTAS